MPQTVPFEMEDGTKIYVEVEDSAGGMQRVGRGGGDEEKTAGKFQEAINQVRPAAEAVLNSLREMNTPDEIGMEFGIKFSAKFGTAILASVDGETTFKVSLKWTNPKKEG